MEIVGTSYDCSKPGLVGGLDRITCAHNFHVTEQTGLEILTQANPSHTGNIPRHVSNIPVPANLCKSEIGTMTYLGVK